MVGFQRHRRLLVAADVILGLGVLGCLVGFLFPVDVQESPRDALAREATQAEAMQTTIKPLKNYDIIFARDLRKPLYDPKPVNVVKTPPPKPPLTVDLLGTVLEDGFTYAILKNRSGKTSFVPIGESLDGAEVTKIEKNSATVSFHGESIVLKVKGKVEK
ncbi:MAG: hypothetical protein JW849_00190 [Phycisphaerae bacterium]|nr:hypothetical protein [Phycisphaerae bacterium]